MNNIQEIIDKIKTELINYTGNPNIANFITNNIKINFLDKDDFLKEVGVDSFSNAPGAFHKTSDNSINILKKDNYTKMDYHKLIHEMLHAYSNNYFKSGKSGLQVSGYDENDKLISVGGVINEAATEYLTSIINKDGFIGYPDDMNYVFELFIDVLDMRRDFVELYFQHDNWITDEMNKRFNANIPNQLDEFILEFDNRLPMYRKKTYDFNKIVSILLNAINSKLSNKENINYELISNDLMELKKADFDFSVENISAINNLQERIKIEKFDFEKTCANLKLSENEIEQTIKEYEVLISGCDKKSLKSLQLINIFDKYMTLKKMTPKGEFDNDKIKQNMLGAENKINEILSGLGIREYSSIEEVVNMIKNQESLKEDSAYSLYMKCQNAIKESYMKHNSDIYTIIKQGGLKELVQSEHRENQYYNSIHNGVFGVTGYDGILAYIARANAGSMIVKGNEITFPSNPFDLSKLSDNSIGLINPVSVYSSDAKDFMPQTDIIISESGVRIRFDGEWIADKTKVNCKESKVGSIPLSYFERNNIMISGKNKQFSINEQIMKKQEFLKRAKELGLDVSKIPNMNDLLNQQQTLEQQLDNENIVHLGF